jgi:hypothetical protein
LRQQIEALEEHAKCEGYRVLETVSDGGYSGTTLERPGKTRITLRESPIIVRSWMMNLKDTELSYVP